MDAGGSLGYGGDWRSSCFMGSIQKAGSTKTSKSEMRRQSGKEICDGNIYSEGYFGSIQIQLICVRYYRLRSKGETFKQ